MKRERIGLLIEMLEENKTEFDLVNTDKIKIRELFNSGDSQYMSCIYIDYITDLGSIEYITVRPAFLGFTVYLPLCEDDALRQKVRLDIIEYLWDKV